MKRTIFLIGAAAAAICAVPAQALQQPVEQSDKETPAAPKKGAPAPDGTAEIVVTAERRAESMQSLPVAISAFSADTLKDRGVVNLNSLSQLSPSVRVPGSANGGLAVNVALRGIGSFGGFEPAVAMVQDGVSYATRRIGTLDFFDVERVEVLRGPQGTLGGRNATAGGVYIISAKPSATTGGYINATLGNYDRIALEGAITGPIAGDKLLGRLAVQVDQADGWFVNERTHQGYGGINKRQARLTLLAKPSDTLEATLILQGRIDEALPALVSFGRSRPDQPSFAEANGVREFDPRNKSFVSDQTDIRKDKFFQGTLRVAWDISDTTTLTSTTGYVKSHVLFNWDQDSTEVFNVAWPKARKMPVWQASQELTLSGKLTDRLDYIVGGLFLKYDYELHGNVVFVGFGFPPEGLPFRDQQKLSSWSGFAQLRYDVTDDVRLTAGARYTHDKKSDRASLGGANSAGQNSWSAWTPRVSIDWKPNDALMLYATASRGFKSGGFDEFAFPSRSYNPEYVWNYEVGVKAKALDNRLTANLTGFMMNYSNLQQTITGLDPGDITFRTVNASTGKIKGVELELEAFPVDSLHLTASGAYLDTKYEGLRSADPIYPELGIRDLSGNQIAGASKWQFNVGGDYTVPIGGLLGTLKASYAWNSKTPLDIYSNPGFEQDSVGVLNASASLSTEDKAWEVTAFAQNLTNELYVTNVQAQNVGGGGFQRGTSFGDVRRYGIRVGHRF